VNKVVVMLVCLPATATAMTPTPGEAAVRTCMAIASSGPQAAPTVAAGQKLALSAWAQVAKVMGGDSHTSWRLALTKTLTCAPAAVGTGVVCEARARPCVIDQVPGPGERYLPETPTRKAPEPKVIPVPPNPAPKKPINI
jgi:hypothetical protein